jgi:hypothetical protein
MNWVWQLDLPSFLKLVLLKLADHANEHGICHPSIAALARSCSVSERTIQRAIRDLCDRGLIQIECRHRPDGSQRSNQYRLALSADRVNTMTPPTDNGMNCPPSAPTPGDIGVTQTTTQSPIPNSQQPLSGGWIFPKRLTDAEQRSAVAELRGMDPELAQVVLDELAGRLCKGNVHRPVSYLRQLAKCARAGSFVPEMAVAVRARRSAEAAYASQLAAAASDLPPKASVETLVSLPDSLRTTMLKIKAGINRRGEVE